jgi:putative YphP/YqiW family bacilliredoxin
MTNAYEEYMRQVTMPMRTQLTDAGFDQLQTADEVHDFMETTKGVALVVINSVCGCAAGLARPAAIAATEAIKVDQKVTVFAGQDQEATATMRGYFDDIPPSSPSMAILKDGQLAYFVPREQIEGFPAEHITANLTQLLDELCNN